MNTSNQLHSTATARGDSAAFVTQLFTVLQAADLVTVDGYEACDHQLSDDGMWRMDTASGEPNDSRIWFKDQIVEITNGVVQATCADGQEYTLELHVKRVLSSADLLERAADMAVASAAMPLAVVSAPVGAASAGAGEYDGEYMAIMQFMEPPSQTRCQCGGGCTWKGFASELTDIQECVLTPGHASPAGRCPDCDALAYVCDDTPGAAQ